MPYTLTIGRRYRVENLPDLAACSREYQRLRDLSGEGSSSFPDGHAGPYEISYNGRVWDRIGTAPGNTRALLMEAC